MIIAVMSDLHDNVATWNIISKILSEKKIKTLINCGDTIAPAMLKHMAETFNGEIITVYGNNADRQMEMKVAETLSNVKHYVDHGDLVVNGRRISFNHYPEVAERDAASGNYDLVCHGHTHLKRWEKVGKTYILNPGTAGGMFQYPSLALVNLDDMHGEFIEVKL